jgi:hypothetical protein
MYLFGATVVGNVFQQNEPGSAAMNVQQSRIAVMKKVGDKWKFALIAIYSIPSKN